MSDAEVLALMLVVGGITFLYRYAMIGLFAHRALTPWLARLCQFVAPASFAALIATTLFVTGHEVHVEFSSPKLWAALVAGIVAWKSGNVFATIATGMGTLYLLKWLLSTGLL